MDKNFDKIKDELKISEKNLMRLRDKDELLRERKTAHLIELATELGELWGTDEFLAAYRATAFLSAGDRATVCRMIASARGLTFADVITTLRPDADDGEMCVEKIVAISYGNLCDASVRMLEGAGAKLRTLRVESFSEACEAVSDGDARYCVIPHSSSVDGRLSLFSKLMRKYALKTLARCRVMHDDGEFETAALLCGGFDTDLFSDTADTSAYTLEIEIPRGSEISLSDALDAAKALGMTQSEVATVPTYGGAQAYAVSFPLNGNGAGLAMFFAASREPVFVTGFYKTIK